MDLAKIRNKYRKPLSGASDPDAAASVLSSEPAIEVSVPSETELFNNIIPGKTSQIAVAVNFPERIVAYRDPVEVILAGRSAAGCDEEAPDEDISPVVPENCLECLCFSVSDEVYGIGITHIKEIIKPRKVTEIPHAPEFVSGIISLRGTIIPIIDMHPRLGLSRENVTGKERIVVTKKDQSFYGLLVDEVIQTMRINNENIEPAPSVLEGINRDFVSGIGRSEGRLVIILNPDIITDIHLH